jgi:hypothetical protein
MHIQPHLPAMRGPGIRRLMGATFVASFIALLAAIPTGTAMAASGEGSAEVAVPVSLASLDPLLGATPVGTLETGATGLTNLSLLNDLDGLPEFSGLLAPVRTLLNSVLTTLLATNPTLNEVTGDLNGEGVKANPTEVVSMLLEKLTPTQGTALVEELFGSVPSSSLNSLLGSTLTGQPFTQTTVGDLANKLGITTEKLAEDVGTTALQLPATVTALTSPLANGKLLTVLDGPEGIQLTTVETKEATKEREAKERSENGVPGSNGNPGSNGSGAGSGTVVVNLPAAAVPAVPLVVATKAPAKIKILSHKVKGHIATLVLQIPAAGKVTVSGGGVRAIGKGATKAERLTVRIPLSKAGTASLRKHHHRLSVALKASFKPTNGTSSSAGVTVHFA